MKPFPPLSEIISPQNEEPLIISHRGDWTNAPENSLSAILLAVEAGADMVEIDCQRTTSGALYLMHDDTTDRMTSRAGTTTSVSDAEFDDLFLRGADGGPDAPMSPERAPSLRDALEMARGRVHLNIDTKHRRDLEAVGDLVFEMGMQDQVLIKMTIDPDAPDLTIRESSWYDHLIFMPVLLDPQPGKLADHAIELVECFDAKIVEISFLTLQELKQTAKAMRARGVRLWCNTLNPVHPLDYSDDRALQDPDGVWGTLIRSGVGAIQTDETPALGAYLGRRRKPP